MRLFSFMRWIFPLHLYQPGVVAAVVVGGGMVASAAMAPEAPDPTPGIEASAKSSEKVGMAQIELAERQRQDSLARNAKLDALTEQVAGSQVDSMRKQDALADEYADYNRTTFRPLEQSIVDEARNFDTPLEQERMAGQAGAEVKQNLTTARAGQAREMQRMGVNPNSERYQSSANDTTIRGALAEAGAENAARQAVRTLGGAKRMDAASLGRGLPAANATSAGLALTAGNSVIANTAAANANANASAQTTSGILSGANGSFGTAAGAYGQSAANAAAIYGVKSKANSDLWGSAGSAAGMYYGMKKT